MTDPALFRQQTAYTPAEQVIMDYIVTNPQEFLLLSIKEVARRLEVSEATISRFARHAGFDDFKALKNGVASQTLGPADKISASIDESGGDARAFMIKQRDYIETTLEGLDAAQFERAVGAVAGARRVYLHGKGAAGALAELLEFRLKRYGIAVERLASGGSELMEGLAYAGAGDAIVLFGFQRVPVEGQVLIDVGRRCGCTTVIFTDRMVQGGGQKADVILYTYRGEPRAYHSMTSAVALLDALVVAVGARLDGKALEGLDRIRDLKRAYAHLIPR